MKIIGIGGTNGSGKDTVAHILEESHDFFFVSGGKMLVEELKKNGLPQERKDTSALSAKWRKEFGLGVIIDKAIDIAKEQVKTRLTIASLRNPGEVDRVHELGGIVIWVDADPKIRYKRIIDNNRERVSDNKTYEQFLAEEADEMDQAGGQNTLSMSAVKQKSDIFIENNFDNIEDFSRLVQKVLEKYVK